MRKRPQCFSFHSSHSCKQYGKSLKLHVLDVVAFVHLLIVRTNNLTVMLFLFAVRISKSKQPLVIAIENYSGQMMIWVGNASKLAKQPERWREQWFNNKTKRRAYPHGEVSFVSCYAKYLFEASREAMLQQHKPLCMDEVIIYVTRPSWTISCRD